MSDDDTLIGQRQAELAKMGMTDDEVRDGARFEIEADDADPRFEWVRIRQPRTSLRQALGGTRLSGEHAQWRAMYYSLASACGIAQMFAETLPLRAVQGLMVPVAIQSFTALGEIVGEQVEKLKSGVSPRASTPKA